MGAMTRKPAVSPDTRTVAAEPPALRYGAVVGLPVLGGVLGLLVALLTHWVAGLPWAPFQGAFTAVASLPQPLGTIAIVVFGVIAGAGFASFTAAERLTATITPEQVELQRGRREARTVDGRQVRAAFVDGGMLVLLDERGDELAREATRIPAMTLRLAFEKHGYRWLQGDPHASDYREWDEDDAELGVRAHGLLRTRRQALAKRHAAEAAQLRDELARQGVLVRDEKRRQYWRPRPGHGE